MNERIRSILEHMLEDAKDIIAFSQAVGSLEELRKNSLIKKGIVMSLLNIGELASKLPSKFTDEYPQIPWRSMVGMRNFAAHGYPITHSTLIESALTTLADFGTVALAVLANLILECGSMIVTSTEIKNNFGKYIRLAVKEDIIITSNGKKVGKLVAYREADHESCSVVGESMPAYNYDRMRVTYEEFLEINTNCEERYEYIDGRIYLLASPTTTHQKILFEMSVIFYNWFKGKKCTPMIAPYDIKLKRNENSKNVVQPDIMVICDLEENLGEDDYYHGVPVLMVEIISKSTRSKDYVKKMDLYMCCGVSEYWIVNLENREVHVFLFKDGDVLDNKTFMFDDEIRSFYFKDLTLRLAGS